MKEDLNKQDEALDSLLKLAENPQAPDWFEARTLARLRREREEASSFSAFLNLFSGKALRSAGLLALLAVACGLGFQTLRKDSPGKESTAAVNVQDEQLFAAFDAFDSYARQANEWNQELF